MALRVAYLFFAYRNPLLIRRAVDRLNSSNAGFFVHIDKKVDINQFAAVNGQNVFFTQTRLPVYWAEFSGVEAVLVLMREAVAAAQQYDYFVLLSGSDYPLRSAGYIERFLSTNRGREFITMVPVPNEEAGKPLSRLTTVRFPSSAPIRRAAFRMFAKCGLARRDYTKYLDGLVPYAGSTWWTLTRQACEYILEYVERDDRLIKFFANTFAPEESFFHTILGNSPFGARSQRSLVFEDWSKPGGHPLAINMEHIASFAERDKICADDLYSQGELLFARKFDDENLHLVEKVDSIIDQKDPSNRR